MQDKLVFLQSCPIWFLDDYKHNHDLAITKSGIVMKKGYGQ